MPPNDSLPPLTIDIVTDAGGYVLTIPGLRYARTDLVSGVPGFHFQAAKIAAEMILVDALQRLRALRPPPEAP